MRCGDKLNYMFLFIMAADIIIQFLICGGNTGRCVTTFQRVEQFKYFGTTLTDQNSVYEEIKSRLKSGNTCHHSVQNLLSSSLLSKI